MCYIYSESTYVELVGSKKYNIFDVILFLYIYFKTIDQLYKQDIFLTVIN